MEAEIDNGWRATLWHGFLVKKDTMEAYDYDDEQVGNLFIVKKDGTVGSAFPVYDGEIMIGRCVVGRGGQLCGIA